MRKKLPTWIAICAAGVCAAAVALGANKLTASQLERQRVDAEGAAFSRVMDAAAFELLEVRDSRYGLDAAYEARDASGAAVGYVGRATVTGYGGPVEVTAGLDMEGAITGVQVGGEDFAETPGLGALTREPAFTGQFVGKTPDIALGEGGVDSVSGASTTSRAVVSGVNGIANYFYTGELGLKEENVQAYAGQTVSQAAQGYGGEVTVTVGMAGDGTIEYLAVDTPNETDGLGKRCSEPEFTNQFIGKAGPFAYGEDGIDAVSGATVTSTAVLDALNDIVPPGDKAAAAASRSVAAPESANEPEPEAKPAGIPSADASAYMRPRPVAVEAETAGMAEASDYMEYLRPRPAIASVRGDAMKYMRPRPAA